MNSLTVDGATLSAGEIGGTNLEEILINLMEHSSVINRTITQVLINGDLYSEEVPHAALEVERSQIDCLELVTYGSEELSYHFLEHGHYFVDSLRKALPKIVDEFRLGEEMEANENFLNFLEPLHLLLSTFDQVKNTIGIRGDLELKGGKGDLDNFMVRLSETLDQMSTIQEQSDWIYLADILEYDLDNFLVEFNEFLSAIKQIEH